MPSQRNAGRPTRLGQAANNQTAGAGLSLARGEVVDWNAVRPLKGSPVTSRRGSQSFAVARHAPIVAYLVDVGRPVGPAIEGEGSRDDVDR